VKPITIYFVEQEDQRIPGQVGDRYETDSGIWIKITRFDNPAYSLAILQHELRELFHNRDGTNQEDDLK
jgi:hypothetical protein